jgi:hypothetical protein
VKSHKTSEINDSAEELKGVKSDVGDDPDVSASVNDDSTSKEPSAMKKSNTDPELSSHGDDRSDMPPRIQVDGEDGVFSGEKHLSTGSLPDGVPESDLEDRNAHSVGQLIKADKDETIS